MYTDLCILDHTIEKKGAKRALTAKTSTFALIYHLLLLAYNIFRCTRIF